MLSVRTVYVLSSLHIAVFRARATAPVAVQFFQFRGTPFWVATQQMVNPVNPARGSEVVGKTRRHLGGQVGKTLRPLMSKLLPPPKPSRLVDVEEVVFTPAIPLDEWQGFELLETFPCLVVRNLQHLFHEASIEPAQHRRSVQRGPERFAFRLGSGHQDEFSSHRSLRARVAARCLEALHELFDECHGLVSSSR